MQLVFCDWIVRVRMKFFSKWEDWAETWRAVLRHRGCFYVWRESNLNCPLLSRFPLKRKCTCLTSWCLAPWPFAMVSPPSWRIKKSWRWTHLKRWCHGADDYQQVWFHPQVLHDCRNIAGCLIGQFGVKLTNVFDTQVRVFGVDCEPLGGFSCFSGVFLHLCLGGRCHVLPLSHGGLPPKQS